MEDDISRWRPLKSEQSIKEEEEKAMQTVAGLLGGKNLHIVLFYITV